MCTASAACFDTSTCVLLLLAVFYLIYCLPAGIKKEKVDNALPDFDEGKAVDSKDTRGAASDLVTSASAGLELQRTGAAAPPAGPYRVAFLGLPF